MTNEEAYNALSVSRPIIVKVLERAKPRHRDAYSLAEKITANDDSPELAQLIKQTAEHIYDREQQKGG